MSDSAGKIENRGKGRLPYTRPVKIRYRLFQDFIQEVSTNISDGGMFIAAEVPPEPGTMLDFELALEDGFTLVAGRGEVIWVRTTDDGVDKPAGMGIRFAELRGASRRLINKIIEKQAKQRSGAAKADEARPRSDGPDSAPTEPLSLPELQMIGRTPSPDNTETAQIDTGAFAPLENARRATWIRIPVLILASAAVGGLIVLLFHLTWVRPKIRELEERVEGLADQSARRAIRAAVVGSEEDAPTAVTEPKVTAPDLGPLETVEAWARAWAEGRVEDYLAFYADGFQPAVNMSRAEWESVRRARIARQSDIEVQVLLPEVEEPGADTAVVRFVQAYRSATYQDRVRKTIRLERGDNGWKITAEEVVRALPD